MATISGGCESKGISSNDIRPYDPNVSPKTT